MSLPPDVQTVRAKGRTYFYLQPGRNTENAGKRVSLGSDAGQVWTRYEEELAKIRAAGDPSQPGPGHIDTLSFEAMIDAWRGNPARGIQGSPEWRNGLSEGTQRDYSFYLDKMVAIWGTLPAAAISPRGILAYRDTMQDSPGSANHMLVVGKQAFKWGVPRGYAPTNPFREIAALKADNDGHRPWPQWALDYAAAKMWPDLARFVFLALHTGQRESDVIRMGPGARENRGLIVRPKKTRKTRRAFYVPLLGLALAEIDRWEREPLEFVTGRWGNVVKIDPGAYYVTSPAGNPYTTAGLQSRWNRWLRTPEGKTFWEKWRVWERAMRERDGEDIPEDEELKPTLHGLRATAVVHRRLAGYTHQQVSNDIGMSIQMVTRYSRFMDQREAAETNIVALEAATARRAQK